MKKYFELRGIVLAIVFGLAMLQLSFAAPSAFTSEITCHNYISYHIETICKHGVNSIPAGTQFGVVSESNGVRYINTDPFSDSYITSCCYKKCTIPQFKQYCKPDPKE